MPLPGRRLMQPAQFGIALIGAQATFQQVDFQMGEIKLLQGGWGRCGRLLKPG
jgi:hypothetical protein